MGLEDEKRNRKLQEAPLSPEEEAAVRGFRFKTQPELAERWLQRPEQQGRKMEDAVRAERERLSKKTRSWWGVTQPVPDDATLKERLLKREWTERYGKAFGDLFDSYPRRTMVTPIDELEEQLYGEQ